MPVREICHNFFKDALSPFHKYRQNALIDATIALINGASLTLTSIGRFLPGNAHVKHKIKRIDRLLGNEALHRDIPDIFRNIIAMLTESLSLCVIAVDWSGYPSQEHHVLRASLICDGRSIPLLSQIVTSCEQQNVTIQNAFLDMLASAVNPKARVIIVTDAGFQNAGFKHIKTLGWDFVGRIRGNTQLRLEKYGELWFKRQALKATTTPQFLGFGTLSKAEYARCDGYFYLHKRPNKRPNKGRKFKKSRYRMVRKSQVKDGRSAAMEPWLIFTSMDDFKPRQVMKIYSRRM
ncbi:transposase (fragment) [Xenorhabdus bovienii str. feltiae Moldova]|uniref:Transposase n=1 Tax=Xenorhabdus bovienii str. feltiae Moldova TaxID=1398200 RepID=A0A077NLU5_XENBV